MIAIPVDTPDAPQAGVSEYFGDVAFFQLYNDRGALVRTLPNDGRGSGQRLSTFLAEQGVTQVVFRHLGDKLFGWLGGQGIDSFAVPSAQASIAEVLEALRDRRLERVSDANVGRLLHPAGPGTGCHCADMAHV